MPNTAEPHARRARPGRRTLAAAALATTALLSLAGCGGSDGDDDGGADVASLQSPSGDAAAESPSAGQSGPPGVQLRMDTSSEERNRIRNAWVRCLEDNGVPSYTERDPARIPGPQRTEIVGPIPRFPEGDEEDHPDAYKKCEDKRPLTPIPLDRDRNPQYDDDFRAWVTCMNDRGLAVKATATGPTAGGWTYTGGGSVDPGTPEAGKVERECKRKAFSG